ncbi:MAG: glycosyltransferase [Lachnospiraceae bacterium]|nr:glycosyltransferase [Lachnospiraceae bacterium]
MTTSVCMGTYNGEKYITEQLYSILHQTKQPDEVILCDDGSKDGTVYCIQKFIAENQLADKWHLYENTKNKGYPNNFYYACSLCTKEVVFLADQDDIWDVRKLERMCQILEDGEDIQVVCCKFGLIDEVGTRFHTIMAPTHTKGTKQLRQITIEDVFYKCEWPGMVVAYRNDWYTSWTREGMIHENVTSSERYFHSRIPHDFLICAKAAESHAFIQMDEELAYHRRHDSNVGGEEHRIQRLLNKARKLHEIEKYLKILTDFEQENVLKTQEGKTALYKKTQSMQQRLNALQSGKISRVIDNARKNRENVRFATMLCDILIVKQK